jgi:hypothetical protein
MDQRRAHTVTDGTETADRKREYYGQLINDAPVAEDDNHTNEDGSAGAQPTGFHSDIDGDTITIASMERTLHPERRRL